MLRNEFFIVGKTPLISNMYNGREIYIKLESSNPSGSMKDRAAIYIINSAFKLGLINNQTTIIESSSGNFGVALAAVCKKMGLHFICVIDANINSATEKLLIAYGTEIIKITEADEYGGYLINRLTKVKEIISQSKNVYWTNQYENMLNADAYHSLADEILSEVRKPDYVFIPVSSGGTITGISCRIKEKSPQTKIIAVDSMGSIIFGGQARKRLLPGLGSSIVPSILKHAQIDDIVTVEEINMINECHVFFDKNNVMIGGSSGACLYAIKKYCECNHIPNNSRIVTIFADKGERYIDTIYDDNWCWKYFKTMKQRMC